MWRSIALSARFPWRGNPLRRSSEQSGLFIRSFAFPADKAPPPSSRSFESIEHRPLERWISWRAGSPDRVDRGLRVPSRSCGNAYAVTERPAARRAANRCKVACSQIHLRPCGPIERRQTSEGPRAPIPMVVHGRGIAERPCHSRVGFPYGAYPVGTAADLHENCLVARVARRVTNGPSQDQPDRELPKRGIVVVTEVCEERTVDRSPRIIQRSRSDFVGLAHLVVALSFCAPPS